MTINAMKSKNRNSKAQSSATSHAVSNPSSKDISISTIGKSESVETPDPPYGENKKGGILEEEIKKEEEIRQWCWWLPEGE